MKQLYILGIVLASVTLAAAEIDNDIQDCEFVILITSYKNEKYVEENLTSCCWQESSRPYQIIYVDDCSPDETTAKAEEFVRNHDLKHVTIIRNEERMGSLANHYNPIYSLIPDHKIVLSLDGDDMLAHNGVLKLLESYYADPDIWMTYGTAKGTPYEITVSRGIPDSVFYERNLRGYEWCSSHLKTFKAGLFKKIQKEDFLYNDSFMRVSGDQAMMLPMLEMCSPQIKGGKNHSCYIKEILYLYRMDNPINNHNIRIHVQEEVADFIRSKEPYEPLDILEFD